MRVLLLTLAVLMTAGTTVRADDEKSAAVVRVYPVADLVAQPADVADSGVTRLLLLQQAAASAEALQTALGKESKEDAAISRNLKELADLLQTTTVPNEWEVTGGEGRISTYNKTLSLVVRQTERGHDEITELLERLRQENNIRVELTIEYLEETKQQVCQPAVPQAYTIPAGYSPYASPATQPYSMPVPQTYPAAAQAYVPQVFSAQPSTRQPVGEPVAPPIVPAKPAKSLPPSKPTPTAVYDQPPAAAPNVYQALQPSVVQRSSKPSVVQKPVASLADVLAELSKKHGSSMDDEESREFREKVKAVAKTQLLQKSVQTNGRSRMAGPLVTSSIISPDRRFVDVSVSLPSESGTTNGAVRIPDGDTVTVQLPQSDSGEFVTLLVRAKIRVPEEAEEKAK